MSTDRPIAVDDAWQEFASDLRAFIGRRVGNPDDADDILQLVAVRLVQHASTGRDRQTILAWLYTVTRNAITDYYRSAPRRREVPHADLPDRPLVELADNADNEEIRAGLAACIRPLMATLPASQAAAVELVDLDGATQVEAARRAGISVSGMKSRVQRGRQALYAAITACCAVELDARGSVQDFRSRAGTDCRCSAA